MSKKTKSSKPPVDEQLDNQDIDLFKVLDALDTKDYDYFQNLTPEQQRKIVPHVLIQWLSSVSTQGPMQEYFLRMADSNANRYLLDETVNRHPLLQWLMLCTVSPTRKRAYHSWIPRIKERVVTYKEAATRADTKAYFKKAFGVNDPDILDEAATIYMAAQHKKHWIAERFPTMKLQDIEALSAIITEDEMQRYDQDAGNL